MFRVSLFLRRLVTFAIIFLIFYFLIRSIIANWQKIDFSQIRFSFSVLGVSLFFLIASSFLGNFAWCSNLRYLGARIDYFQGLRIIGISQMGKYIPGKVWSVGGRIILAKRYNIPEVITSTAILIETISVSLSALVLFLVSLSFFGKSLPQRFYLSFIFIPLSLFFLHPKILKKFLILGGKILKREMKVPEMKIGSLLLIYLIYFVSWLVHTMGFFFLVRSIYPVAFTNLFGVMGSFSFAWVSSAFVIFLPAGFGVREGVLAFLLRFFLPLPIAALMSFLGRLWTTLGELVILLLALLLRSDYEKREEGRS